VDCISYLASEHSEFIAAPDLVMCRVTRWHEQRKMDLLKNRRWSQRNIDAKAYAPGELEKIKLEDGV